MANLVVRVEAIANVGLGDLVNGVVQSQVFVAVGVQ